MVQYILADTRTLVEHFQDLLRLAFIILLLYHIIEFQLKVLVSVLQYYILSVESIITQ